MKPLFKENVTFAKSFEDAKAVLVIDVSNFIHRMTNAHSSLTTSYGDFSGHIHGCLTSLKSLIKLVNSPRILIVFVADGSPIKRVSMFPGYKKRRHASKEERDEDQKTTDTYNFYNALRVLHFVPGLSAHDSHTEADDVAAAYTLKSLRAGKKTYVVSNDRDLWQMSCYGATIIGGNKLGALNKEGIKKVLGFPPERLHLFKAMYGDKSDEIPGVFRMPKAIFTDLTTATNLAELQEQVKAKSFPKKARAWVLDNFEQITFNWILTQLEESVKYTVTRCGDLSTLRTLVDDYECKSLIPWVESLGGVKP